MVDFFEVLNGQRAVREFKPDPVPEEDIKTILKAAVKAPSGGNSQPWEFVVVRDSKVKLLLKEPIADSWHKYMDSPAAQAIPPDKKPIYEKATEMVDKTEKVPVIIFACVDLNKASKASEVLFSSIYPAVQNVMLAARALGLGSCLTTHASTGARAESDVKSILGIPDHVKICAAIYLGYPTKKYGPPTRHAVEQRTHFDKW